MYANRVTLIGFLGQDAQVRSANNGTFVILSLATNRNWKDRATGERKSQASWHRCIVWGALGTFAGTLTKGAHLHIEGAIETRSYTSKSGDQKAVTEVRVSDITLLDRAKKARPGTEIDDACGGDPVRGRPQVTGI